METMYYSNLANSLVGKLSNMKDAGIIDDFNATLWVSSNEQRITKNSIAITLFLLPYGMKYFTVEEGEENVEDKVREFDDMLNDLICKAYEKVSVQKEACEKIEDNFRDIIAQ